MPARWKYILQEAAIGLRRNLYMTVAVVMSVTVSLALFGASILLREQVGLVTGELVGNVEMSVFLCDGRVCPEITDSQQTELQRDLQENPLVRGVEFQSKEDAYESFLELFAEQPDIIENVAPDTLPASFRVQLVDPEQFEAVRSQYIQQVGIEDITDPGAALDGVLKLANLLRYGALVVAIVQMLASTVLVANTVRVAAFARRDQTQIMKLVGASNWYIRLPFVAEGMLAGLFGALIAWGALVAVTPWLGDRVAGIITFFPTIGLPAALAVWPWLLVPALLITSISSLIALWGFLDV